MNRRGFLTTLLLGVPVLRAAAALIDHTAGKGRVVAQPPEAGELYHAHGLTYCESGMVPTAWSPGDEYAYAVIEVNDAQLALLRDQRTLEALRAQIRADIRQELERQAHRLLA